MERGIFYALHQLRVLNVSTNINWLKLLDYSSNNVRVLEDYVFNRLERLTL